MESLYYKALREREWTSVDDSAGWSTLRFALSRRKHGFESRWACQKNQWISTSAVAYVEYWSNKPRRTRANEKPGGPGFDPHRWSSKLPTCLCTPFPMPRRMKASAGVLSPVFSQFWSQGPLTAQTGVRFPWACQQFQQLSSIEHPAVRGPKLHPRGKFKD